MSSAVADPRPGLRAPSGRGVGCQTTRENSAGGGGEGGEETPRHNVNRAPNMNGDSPESWTRV